MEADVTGARAVRMFGMSYEARWALGFGLTAAGVFLIAMILSLSLLA